MMGSMTRGAVSAADALKLGLFIKSENRIFDYINDIELRSKMSNTLDLDGVVAFLRAAEFSSFTRAAEALGTAQSLVSTRIKKLEEALGQLLLQRHPRRPAN
jgi:molybdenum-dependent DNA-binding transcriptional regulator ModE